MAERVEGIRGADAPHFVHLPTDREFFEIMRWVRDQGSGRFDYRFGIGGDPYRSYLDLWFSDATTAFWCKMKFG